MPQAPRDIVQYDLTPTLKHDLRLCAGAARAWDECHAVATLQGIVNRLAPRLYVRFVAHSDRNIDDWWLDHLRRTDPWLAGTEITPVADLAALMDRFRTDCEGVVLYDDVIPAASNVASTAAGVLNLIAVRHDPARGSVYNQLVAGGPRLPVKLDLTAETMRPAYRRAAEAAGLAGSLKCGAYAWALEEFVASGRCDPAFLAYYIDAYWMRAAFRGPGNHHTLTNHDYFVARRAYFCDLHCWGDEQPVDEPDQPPGADLAMFRRILATLHARNRGGITHIGGFTPWAYKYTSEAGAGGGRGGVDTEWELVRVASAYNGFIDADALGHGALANASFYAHYPLAESYPQFAVPSMAEAAPLAADERDLLMFYVGDYDAAAWVYQRMPDLWEDPQRGAVPLSWALSPVLERRVPHILAHLWKTRAPGDAFIAADNGAGYLNPSMLAAPRPLSDLPDGVDAWVRHCTPLYRRWNLAITGFIIDGHAPPMPPAVLDAYARFSPGGIVPQKTTTELFLHGEMPVLRFGPDITDAKPDAAAASIARHVADRRRRGLRFHWMRCILRSPSWYAAVVDELRRQDPRIEVVAAPTFFARLKATLRAGTAPQ
ncbi:MAG: hypothetical protein IPM18_16445 [Phycisphaerales bacterium]|nr:hypothetical protein [Phycisphaerales bacterium]